MHAQRVELFDYEKNTPPMNFAFDDCLWSMDGHDADGNPSQSQADVFQRVGLPLLKHAFKGYNTTLFAYGQTGSGKTHTMMGLGTDHLSKGGRSP